MRLKSVLFMAISSFLLVLTSSVIVTRSDSVQDQTISSVFFDDSRVFLNVTPHTLVGSGWVVVDLRSKVYSGDVNLVVGVDSGDLKADGLERFNPHNETFNYTCDGVNTFFNYTLVPKHFWCYENLSYQNLTNTYMLLFDRNFDFGNLSTKTAFWSESVDWTPMVVPITTIPYSFDGKDKWYFAENLPIVSGVDYRVRIHFSVAPTQLGTAVRTYKYDFGIYPSSYGTTASGLLNATSNDHLYFIDPWTRGTTENVAYFNLSETSGTLVVNMLDGFNMTNNNSAVINTNGKIGVGYNFSSATNMYLESQYASQLSAFAMTHRAFSATMWVNLNDSNRYDTVFRLWDQAADRAIEISFLDLTDSLTFETYSKSVELKDTVNYTNNFLNWTFIAITVNETERKMWINNQLVVNVSKSWFTPITTKYVIVGNSDYRTRTRAVNGNIDEINLFNRTINATEVDYLFNNNAPGQRQRPPYVSPLIVSSNFSYHSNYATTNVTVNFLYIDSFQFVNFTLSAPNGSILINNENATNDSTYHWYTRSSVQLTNGTYNVSISYSDGATSGTYAYQEVITDYCTYISGVDQLIGYYNLSETSGDVAVNMLSSATLNMFNLTIKNVTINTPGIIEKGFNFSNASNGVLEKDHYVGLSIGNKGVGVSFWAYLEVGEFYDTIFRLWYYDTLTELYDSAINVGFDPLNDSIAFSSYSYKNAVEDKDNLNFTSYFGKWTHIAFTINSTERKMWINNQLLVNKSVDWGNAGTDTSDIMVDGVSAGDVANKIFLLFGNSDYRVPNRAINGSLDEIAVFNRTITAADVDYLYNNNAPWQSQRPLFIIPCTAGVCVYSSGNWLVDCSDNCIISTTINLNRNNVTFSGVGFVNITGRVFNYSVAEANGGCRVQGGLG